jgi:hypothetical protein
MKRLCLLWLLIASVPCWAQVVDYNKVILPDKTPSISFEEKLVQLAWRNNPSNVVVQQRLEVLKKQQKEAKWVWLDNISAQGNMNEFTINPDPTNTRTIYYPRYNFGVRLSLGTFALTPLRTRIVGEQIVGGIAEVNEQKIKVRKEVLIAVERLKEQYKILKYRRRLKEDFLALYKAIEQKFATNQAQIEQYRSAAREYVSRAEVEVAAQSLFNQRKIEVEAYIGVKLEEVNGFDEFLAVMDAETKFE